MASIEALIAGGQREAAWEEIDGQLELLVPCRRADDTVEHLVALALHYDREDKARAWIATYRARSQAMPDRSPRRDALLLALDLRVHLATKDYRAAEVLADRIDWTAADDVPWVVNLRLGLLLRRTGVREALRGTSRSRATLETPYDLGMRLKILAADAIGRDDPSRCRRYCHAALAHFARAPGLRPRLAEVETIGILGRAYFDVGRLDRAEEQFAELARQEAVLGHSRYLLRFGQEMAWIQAYRGNTERARAILDALPLPEPRTLRDVYRRVRVLTTRAAIWLEEGARTEADRELDLAQRMLDRFPHKRLEGYVHLERGRAGRCASPIGEGLAASLEHLQRAEDCFRSLPAPDRHGLSLVRLARGHIYLHHRKLAESLRAVTSCLVEARRRGFASVLEQGLVLKSLLLLERGLPYPERVYEEVLRGLGLVNNAQALFKILANLYMYTWDLDDRLDLTHHHFRQLLRMRSTLGESCFQALYREFVAERVARRAARSIFGLAPPGDAEEQRRERRSRRSAKDQRDF